MEVPAPCRQPLSLAMPPCMQHFTLNAGSSSQNFANNSYLKPSSVASFTCTRPHFSLSPTSIWDQNRIILALLLLPSDSFQHLAPRGRPRRATSGTCASKKGPSPESQVDFSNLRATSVLISLRSVQAAMSQCEVWIVHSNPASRGESYSISLTLFFLEFPVGFEKCPQLCPDLLLGGWTSRSMRKQKLLCPFTYPIHYSILRMLS